MKSDCFNHVKFSNKMQFKFSELLIIFGHWDIWYHGKKNIDLPNLAVQDCKIAIHSSKSLPTNRKDLIQYIYCVNTPKKVTYWGRYMQNYNAEAPDWIPLSFLWIKSLWLQFFLFWFSAMCRVWLSQETPAVVSHHVDIPLSLVAFFLCFAVLMKSLLLFFTHIFKILSDVIRWLCKKCTVTLML